MSERNVLKTHYGNSPFGFEDLEVYKAAQSFLKRIYSLSAHLPQDEKYNLVRQMRRAAVLLTNNLAEGYGRFTWQDTSHFCRQARGSLMELVDDINICRQMGYADEKAVESLRQDAERQLQLINGYIRYLQKNKREEESPK